jgi:hypothetical protein
MEQVFVYLSIAEGFMIVCMLAWEIFWLRKMYQVLWKMPTADQLDEMVAMIKSDRDSIKHSLSALVGAFDPLQKVFSSLTGGMLSGLFGGVTTKVEDNEKTKF